MCNSMRLNDLLNFCLDPDSGITVDELRANGYNKIDQLNAAYAAKAEETIWARSQGSASALTDFIQKIQTGTFSATHLQEAQSLLKTLAAAEEDAEYVAAVQAEDMHKVRGFLNKISQGIYSARHESELRQLLDKLESRQIDTDFEQMKAKYEAAQSELDKTLPVNQFINAYAGSPSEKAQALCAQAADLLKAAADWALARKDWIDATEKDDILTYQQFVTAHPYSEHRDEALSKVKALKGALLQDMKLRPFKYSREAMHQYITSGALTMTDLVDDSFVLTDRGYSHIKQYPTLSSEQRQLPVSTEAAPESSAGNTDIFFFGVSGSGKTCVLAGLLSLAGQLGFSFDPKGPGGGGNYAMDLSNYARRSMLPPATDQGMVQVIDAEIDDEAGNNHKLAFIEMSGEKTARFASMDHSDSLDDLGPGAAGLLTNGNPKVIFFVIDPINDKDINLGQNATSAISVKQSNVLDCVSSLLDKNPDLMSDVVAMHIILTKSDTLGDFINKDVVMDRLQSDGYAPVLQRMKNICQKYDINKATGFEVGLFPFCVGRFMPGDVYTFDGTDSLKILRVVQANTQSVRRKGGFWDGLKDWFNS